MNEQLKKITEEAIERIASCEDQAGLNEIRVAYLGKKGEITQLMKSMKDLCQGLKFKRALLRSLWSPKGASFPYIQQMSYLSG